MSKISDQLGPNERWTLANQRRLNILLVLVSVALIGGFLLSHELWFPWNRSFPTAPLLTFLPWIYVLFVIERTAFVIIVAGLISSFFIRRAAPLLIAISLLAFLVMVDQMRLQPWVYQYFILLIVLALYRRKTVSESSSDKILGLVQLAVASLYFWSGLQKLNHTFAHETLPDLLTSLQIISPENTYPAVVFALLIAIFETSIGCGLLFVRTRQIVVWCAVVMHAAILGLLIAKDYNSIVWLWNAALIVMVLVVFWRSDLSVWHEINFRNEKHRESTLAKVLVLAFVLLPALSFAGRWDMYLSGALYSGNTQVAVIKINQQVFENLPDTARAQVFRTSTGEMMLPLLEWSIADLNVPNYPERRVSEKVFVDVCKLADDKRSIELIIKKTPAILDGKYQVAHVDCVP